MSPLDIVEQNHRDTKVMKTKDELKKEFFNKVKEYYLLIPKLDVFIPDKSTIPYAGRVFDEKDLICLVASALDI